MCLNFTSTSKSQAERTVTLDILRQGNTVFVEKKRKAFLSETVDCELCFIEVCTNSIGAWKEGRAYSYLPEKEKMLDNSTNINKPRGHVLRVLIDAFFTD